MARDLRVERRDRHVAVSLEHQVAVNLVRADEDVAAEADCRKALEVGAAEDAADRVVRVAEDEHPRAIGGGGFERLEVDLPPAVGAHRERRFLVDGPVVLRRAEDGRVDGRLHEHAVLRRRRHAAHLLKAGEHAGLKDDGLRLDAPVVQPREPFDDDLAQFGRLVAIPEHAVLDPRAKGGQHRLRHAEVHVRGPQGQDVRAVHVPLGAVRMAAVDGLVEGVGHGGTISFGARGIRDSGFGSWRTAFLTSCFWQSSVSPSGFLLRFNARAPGLLAIASTDRIVTAAPP